MLRRGRAFEAGRLGDAERHGAQRIARWCRAEHNGFRFRQPFWNTRRALEFDVLDQFHYAEGFVLDGSETVPRPHAWLSARANEVVVDFTGPRAGKRRAQKYPPIRGPVRGSFFYLYLIEDLYSRSIVGWEAKKNLRKLPPSWSSARAKLSTLRAMGRTFTPTTVVR